MNYQLINGKILKAEDALIPLNDLGLLRGYSVFDYFRVLKGVPVFIEDHVARLLTSARKLNLEPRWTAEDLKRLCEELISVNGGGAVNAGMRIIITGGFSPDGYTPTEANLFMTLHPLPQYAPSDYVDGRVLITSNYTRSMADIKTTVYGHVLSLRKKVKEANAIEVLYHTNGSITECSRANIFFVKKDDSIVTPSSDLLMGITRKHVMELARRADYTISEGDVNLDELSEMKEVFVTSTTKGVLPIVQIDDTVIGDGHVGEVAITLRNVFLHLIDEYIGAYQQSRQVKSDF